jgi:hypothetical protein
MAQIEKYNSSQGKYHTLVLELEKRSAELAQAQQDISYYQDHAVTLRDQIKNAQDTIISLETNVTELKIQLRTRDDTITSLNAQLGRNMQLENDLVNLRVDRDKYLYKYEVMRKSQVVEHDLNVNSRPKSRDSGALSRSMLELDPVAPAKRSLAYSYSSSSNTRTTPRIPSSSSSRPPVFPVSNPDDTFIVKEQKISEQAVDAISTKIKDLELLFK